VLPTAICSEVALLFRARRGPKIFFERLWRARAYDHFEFVPTVLTFEFDVARFRFCHFVTTLWARQPRISPGASRLHLRALPTRGALGILDWLHARQSMVGMLRSGDRVKPLLDCRTLLDAALSMAEQE